jgi:outer membrane protein OmpU
MRSIKKIGLSALAGSLIAVTSANAVEMTVSGTAEATYTTKGGKGGTLDTNTGNPLGLNSFISFTGSGELDNGYTASIYSSLTEAGTSRTEANMKLDMGDLGTIVLDQSTDAGGVSKINNMVPTAWEEADHGSGSGLGDLDLAGSENVIAYSNTLAGATVSFEYNPGTGDGISGDGAVQGASAGKAKNISVKGPIGDGFTYGIGYGDSETNAVAKDGHEWGLALNYTSGPVSVGYLWTDIQSETADVNGERAAYYGIAFAVNENLSVSYGRDDVEVLKPGAANITEETTGLSASYTMGSASIRAHHATTDNYNGDTGIQNQATEISLILSF